ncbi:MAG: polyprenyl synthetase family protein [Tepidanaerobacter acetatoxydans]|nr:polyprenyl synthetase family protein [Tepidanaerobacter acetatoxydans]
MCVVDIVFKQIMSEIEEELLILEDDLIRAVSTKRKLIEEPLMNMISSGGKRLRPAMVLAAARFGEYDFEKVRPLALSVELIHTAAIIHDDIVDDSPIRRGVLSIQSQLGKDVAVYAGDYIFCKVFEILVSSAYSNILEQVSKVMSQICEGELKQREDLFNTDLTLKDYLYRIQKKTAILFALSAQMGAAASKAPDKIIKALYNYGINIGMAFQIIDDLLDFTGDYKKLGKPTGSDIREGIITLPAIYALKHSDDKEYLRKIFKNKNTNEDEISIAVEIIKKSGGLKYAEYMAERYVQKAKRSIAILPDTPMKKLLEDAPEVIARKYK